MQALSTKEQEALNTISYRLFSGEDNAIIGNVLGFLITHDIFTYKDFVNNDQNSSKNNIKTHLEYAYFSCLVLFYKCPLEEKK